MNERFKHFVDSLDVSFRRLQSMDPVKVTSLPKLMPDAGIYLFTERNRHLYVGRSNRLRQRIQNHSRPGSNHNSATFAFRLARKASGKIKASYVSKGSRVDLESDAKFSKSFTKAKERVRRMDVRFVEEQDPLKQALLEIYVAVALHTPYNDFETH